MVISVDISRPVSAFLTGVGALATGEAGAEGEAKATGVEETGSPEDGVGMDAGWIFLKKGRERFPQPGILTSQPEESRRINSSIAEKIERLLKVSRNRGSPKR
jgi:hypothetical protein